MNKTKHEWMSKVTGSVTDEVWEQLLKARDVQGVGVAVVNWKPKEISYYDEFLDTQIARIPEMDKYTVVLEHWSDGIKTRDEKFEHVSNFTFWLAEPLENGGFNETYLLFYADYEREWLFVSPDKMRMCG